MDTHTQPLLEKDTKTTSYKKYGATLGIAGVTCAAALLLSGGSQAAVRPNELIELPEDFKIPITELETSTAETCMTSFDRVFKQNNVSINSSSFHSSLDSNGKYQDLSFPADTSSLYWADQENTRQFGGQANVYKQYQSEYGIVWKRPSELPGFTTTRSLWGSEGVSPKVSEQGALGDCWFLSSASAIAEVPSRIKKIFVNTEYPKDGAFEVYLHLRGEKISVNIDDRIPVLNLGDNYTTPYPPVNSKPSAHGAWWLVMLEKAFAKVNINYTGLNSGTPGEALRALTGMPVSQHISSKMTDDELWEIVLSGTKNKDPMAAACQVSHYGLIAGHAYGILEGICLTDSAGNCVHKLIQMRNPWGKDQYTGPWSSDSSEWTPEWKTQAKLSEATDGIFFVPLDQWRNDYTQAFKTHYRDDWNITNVEGNPETFAGSGQASGWIKMNNSQAQDVVLECTQWSSRMFPPGCKNSDTPQSYAFLLYNSQMQKVATTPSMVSCDGGATMLTNLAAGDYNIRVVNFNGSDTGHTQIWNMRSFASSTGVHLAQEKSPYN